METVRSGNIKEMQPGAIKIDGDSEQTHESRNVGRTGRWAAGLAQCVFFCSSKCCLLENMGPNDFLCMNSLAMEVINKGHDQR